MKTLKQKNFETVKHVILNSKSIIQKSKLKTIKGGSIVEENAEGF